MTTERTAAQSADGQSVIQLDERWTRIPDRLTGAPQGHRPQLRKAERARLVNQARALDRQIAGAGAHRMAEVILKLKAATCPLLISGEWSGLVESAARDLKAPDFGRPLAARGEQKRRLI